MGRYLRGEGKLQQKEWKGFNSHSHLVHFLTKTRRDDHRWHSVAINTARDFLEERKVPQYIIKRNDLRKIRDHTPHVLAGELMHELRRGQRDGKVGGGLAEAFTSVFSEAKHLLGIDALQNWVGLGPTSAEMTDKDRNVAAAVQQSYRNIEDRRGAVGHFTRLPEYDTDRIAVWRQPGGQMLVTVHGTTLNWDDIKDDAEILAGAEVRSSELTTLLNEFHDNGIRYDVAGHSLATQFITNAVRDGQAENADGIYLFNPASSPFQNTSYLHENANDPRFTYYMNQGDMVSNGLYQQLSDESTKNVRLGPYRWDPISSHMIGQWVSQADVDAEAAEAAEQQGEDGRKSGWTVNFNP